MIWVNSVKMYRSTTSCDEQVPQSVSSGIYKVIYCRHDQQLAYICSSEANDYLQDWVFHKDSFNLECNHSFLDYHLQFAYNRKILNQTEHEFLNIRPSPSVIIHLTFDLDGLCNASTI